MIIDTDDLIIIESRIVVPAGISIPVVMVMTIVLIGTIDTIDTRCLLVVVMPIVIDCRMRMVIGVLLVVGSNLIRVTPLMGDTLLSPFLRAAHDPWRVCRVKTPRETRRYLISCSPTCRYLDPSPQVSRSHPAYR